MFKAEIKEGMKEFRVVKFVERCIELSQDGKLGDVFKEDNLNFEKARPFFEVMLTIFEPKFTPGQPLDVLVEEMKVFSETKWIDISNCFL